MHSIHRYGSQDNIVQYTFHVSARTMKLPQRITEETLITSLFFMVEKQEENLPAAIMIHVTYTTHLSVFKVLKSTWLTPLGIFKDFVTSARTREI